jgi:hypothetical protein
VPALNTVIVLTSSARRFRFTLLSEKNGYRHEEKDFGLWEVEKMS